MGTPGGADSTRSRDGAARDAVVLGGELASALAAEERRRAGRPPASPLAGVRYDGPAVDLWRWVDARPDTVVAAFADGYGDLDATDRARVRTSLSMDDCYTLVTFVRRCALAAIRTGDPTRVATAFDTLSAVTLERVDWRDAWVAIVLATYAGRRLGLDVAAVAAPAAARAEPDVAEMLTEVTGRPVDLVEICGYREVDTPTGPVFFGDEGEPFTPTIDLLAVALAVAGAIDRDSYRVTDVTAGAELPDVWLGGDDRPDPAGRHAAAATRRLTGCVDVHAEPRPDGGNAGAGGNAHFLLAFVAEAADVPDAGAIAAAAEADPLPGATQLGVARGRLCAVLIARAAVQDGKSIEDSTTIERFRAGITAALADP